jgi:hypothetical protein
MTNQILCEYVRNRNNEPVGCVVAMLYPGNPVIALGWSRCKTKAGDVFNKEMAKRIAMGRLIRPSVPSVIPHDISKALEKMEKRALRYFKGATMLGA